MIIKFYDRLFYLLFIVLVCCRINWDKKKKKRDHRVTKKQTKRIGFFTVKLSILIRFKRLIVMNYVD